MKLFERKQFVLIGISIFLGLFLGAYLISEQYGGLGTTGFIALGGTLVIAIIMVAFLTRIGNK
ncbi:hypothetical protein [Marinoscillum sp. MHG1-6]|uniref:hypothetical protein n=1 Tax=Marinoscillum sp. MHG1-6 TaxID=2959627 RepID=UPI0021572831|nr:hypothetical protein [Marinoscillum sp. MHG1-6]